MTQLAIIRHGHTAWNRAGRIQGRTDIPLAPDVIADLSHYRLPPDWRAATLVCSPLLRARQTAELISGRVPQSVNALVEMDWGDWEGQRSVDLGADASTGFRHVDQWGWDFRPPAGESPADLRSRLQPWLHSLQGSTLAVCHIGVMRVLLAMAYGWEFCGPAPFEIKRNRLYLLRLSGKLEISDPPFVRLLRSTDNPG